MSWDHDDAIRNMLRRTTLVEVDDSGPYQTMRVKGLAGEELRGVTRAQNYGFTSTPPVGAEGILASLGGRSDRAMLLGIEHPGYRPKALGPGATAIYDQFGSVVSMVEANMRIVHATAMTIKAGPTTISIDASGVTIDGPVRFTGPSVRHNGKNIGQDHTHTGVTPGSGSSSVPNA